MEKDLNSAQDELTNYRRKNEYIDLKAKSIENFEENRSELQNEVQELTEKLLKFKQNKYKQFNEIGEKLKLTEKELETSKGDHQRDKLVLKNKISMLESTLRHMCEEKDIRIEFLESQIKTIKTPNRNKSPIPSRTKSPLENTAPLTDRCQRSISPLSRSTRDLALTQVYNKNQDLSEDIKNLQDSKRRLKQTYMSLVKSRANNDEVVRIFRKLDINEKRLETIKKRQSSIVSESKYHVNN